MHTDVFYHLFWQSLTLSKWGGGPPHPAKAVHREFTKRGGELLLNSPQVVISAAGEGMLIFFVWQISNIMHCQIILNMASVTRRPCSQYSDLLWLINSAATACHWTINQDPSPPPPPNPAHPPTLLHLSAHLNMRWRLDGFHKISLWENTAWQSCLHVYAQLSCANGCDNPSHPSLFQIYLHIILIILWTWRAFFFLFKKNQF